MKRIRVTVTQEDIDKGERCWGRACPIARAVQRAGFPRAHVGPLSWWPYREEMHSGEGFRLPQSAARFVERFDTERPVKPATFLLPVSE